MSYIEEAFKEICKDSQAPKTWYVALCVNERRYGGAEEGGWWYDHAEVLEYQFQSPLSRGTTPDKRIF